MPSNDRRNLPAEVMLSPQEIVRDISRQHPDLTEDDLYEIAATLIEEIRAAIRRGDQLGIISQQPDGSVKISYLAIEPAARRLVSLIKLRRPR